MTVDRQVTVIECLIDKTAFNVWRLLMPMKCFSGCKKAKSKRQNQAVEEEVDEEEEEDTEPIVDQQDDDEEDAGSNGEGDDDGEEDENDVDAEDENAELPMGLSGIRLWDLSLMCSY